MRNHRIVAVAFALLACLTNVACSRDPLLVVGLDAADWDVIDPLIEAELLPNLAALVKDGVRAELDCVPALPENPCFCPPVWNSIFTGKPAADHGMHIGRQESSERRAQAIWNVLAADGGSSTLLSLHNTSPPEPDVEIVFLKRGLLEAAYDSFDVWPGGRDDEDASESPDTKPPGLFAKLRLLPYTGDRRPLWRPIARDRVAMEALLRLGASGPTDFTMILIHSTDKSAHVGWQSIQPVADEPVNAAAVVELGRSYAGPVHGPGPLSTGTAVSQYLEADAWLGHLLADGRYPTVVIVSDHGMTRNPGPGLSGQHGNEFPDAHQGVLVIRGPGVKAGLDLGKVSVLDVAPTLAVLLALPVAEDLPGRVLAEALDGGAGSSAIRRVASWED
jgi:hypothetical protein